MAKSASKNSTVMAVLPIRVCLDCDKLLTEASDAMRRHAGDMTVGMFLIHRGDLTEEARQDFKARLVASFRDAQTGWDTYRNHLKEHGILPDVS
jgi:hypothetical protein